MTRPIARNGFGLTSEEAGIEVRAIEGGMRLLADSEAVYREWRAIIEQHAVSGAQVHDARLVAAMRVHRVNHLITFNVGDFRRYREIVAVHPRDVRAL